MAKSYKPDYVLLGVVFLLLVFGLVMVASASIIKGLEFGDRYYYAKHQIIYGILPGLILFLLASKIYYRRWVKLSLPLFALGIAGLVAILVTSSVLEHGGATRWIALGSYTFQPSEFVKMFFIIYLAAWLDKKGSKINNVKSTLFPFLVIMAILSVLIIAQPNLGMLGIVALSALSLYYISGARLIHVFALIVLGISALAVFIKISAYRLERFITFLNPKADLLDTGYQVNQAVIAIGSGGLFGLGLGMSRQKYNYLPEPFGDSIFAIIGEELGFAGIAALITLFLIFIWRCFTIAKNAPDNFGKLLVSGITIMLVFQFFMNIAAITQFMPLTGVPIPFISYGGSALASALFGVGVILNVSRHVPRKSY
ncbi:putative lipid II flippase FtsW [Patescibacteria group bacterium]|nr:putative lipid II flippase FtsW [Patescibacteria group bacterium]MBU4580064.1 putative lipid II flippase FtsW [Patescibacteria group bacterium]